MVKFKHLNAKKEIFRNFNTWANIGSTIVYQFFNYKNIFYYEYLQYNEILLICVKQDLNVSIKLQNIVNIFKYLKFYAIFVYKK